MSSSSDHAARRKSTVEISYSKPGTKPPIYVAGSFCDWQPQEMQYTDEQGEYRFTKAVEVEEGNEYQYKFRVGEGEWWLLNEDEPTVTDNVGNRNNLLTVPIHKEPAEMNGTTEKVRSETKMAATEPVLKDASKLPVEDAQPDPVAVRSDARTPDIASSAAEVADSAMILDHETPTPPISDEEAGRIGFRRMSETPIPEVADTAAEVADSAAFLDKNNMVRRSEPFWSPGSGTVTPDEDKVPLFAHECIQPPPGGFETRVPPKRETVKSKLSTQESAIDFDDPSLEDFPSERNAILEQVRDSQRRMPEDQTAVEGIPPSPVVGGRNYPDNQDLPSPSPDLLTKDDSPSLDSIPEDGEEGYREELLSALPEGTNLNLSNGEPRLSEGGSEEQDIPFQKDRKASVDVQEVLETPPRHQSVPTVIDNPTMDGSYTEPEPKKLPATLFIQGESGPLRREEPKKKEIVPSEEAPSITVQLATPGSSLKIIPTDPFSKPIDSAKATAIEEENGRSQLTSRKQTQPSPERALTPTSMRSAGKDAKSKNFLKAFWRVVFVEWIGGFILRLCGGDRQKA
ncbi:hypothetical protein D0Z07_6849 [Hyphodiscus hymeniophilus]|uniref:AMP-activated protein kinase glycogen-binding domain-containing protein n=1 Tax=Hyphodiscus hymeniophilus TaxID=353542 RepID=A0A9P6VGR6_9HELO|nr:hypothetical protein D0Z07_6849 [Hyphodiscus hymeniophilus]